MLNMRKWIWAFSMAFREEASKLVEEEKRFFREFAKEQMLGSPCQVEVLCLNNPYCLILVFLFDETKQDLTITIHKADWKNLVNLAAKLRDKYSELSSSLKSIYRMLAYFRNVGDSDYAIDFTRNVCCICFEQDVRLFPIRLSWGLEHSSSAQAVAKTIFHLNHCQAQDR